jgi:hypothetical protein
LFTAFFRCAHNAAELQSRLSPCLRRVNVVLPVPPRLHFNVEIQFFLQLLIHPTTEK